ncbi:hypothetical protein FO519_008549 [Halicephalobus sp. NKZ332]|nr:hypothetical protein FO519_008549 [Halicephalobus sp. NKZ332]
MVPQGFYVLIIFSLLLHNSCGRVEQRCDSIDLRNKPHEAFKNEGSQSNWRIYKNCTILDGDFTMSMMLSEHNTDEQFPVFENLREITGSVLIFGVRGLTTLGRIFPNLRIIGGQSLIMNYALVIYQNQDLKTIGLDKLTMIRNGGVRVKDNFELCYAETINWDSILIGKLRDVVVENGGTTRNSMDTVKNNCNEYNGCKVDNSEKCQKVGDQLAYCKYHKLSDDTIGPGCSSSGEKCHSECIGGCEVTDDPGTCHGCRNFEVNGTCVSKCPLGTYELLDWRCITQEECNSRRPVSSSMNIQEKMVWKAFAGKCHYDCPKGYEEDIKDKTTCKRCESYCPKKCAGGIIHSIGDALKYSKCNIIEGNLEINVKIGTEVIPAGKFTEAFGEIEQIAGFLLIQMSYPFTDLHMFRSLKNINGSELVNNKYALVIEENPNLQELFNIEEQPLKILNGSVSFQANKMLCMEKIEEFLRHIGTDPAKADVSRFSNGDKAVCNEVLIEFTLTKVSSNMIHLRWPKFNTSNMDQEKFLGYQVFFKKVDYMGQKLSINEDRSACGDSWSMEFFNSSVDVENDGIIIPVDPNTVYAYYVQTRLVNHPGARSGISDIQFVKTHFHYPDPPTIKKATVLDACRIALELEPPREPRGNITHYQISWLINEDKRHITFQDPCIDLPHQIQQAKLAMEKEKREKNQRTCSKVKDCCNCKDAETPDSEDSEMEALEEISNCLVPTVTSGEKEPGDLDKCIFVNVTEFAAMNINAVNVSSTKIILSGLKHFTEYEVQVLSCQDEMAIEHWCSKTSKGRVLRTKPLPDNDEVDYGSIKIDMVEPTNENNGMIGGYRITWAPPEDPNSVLIAFKVKVSKDDGDTPLEQCVRYDDYIANGKGVVLNGLTNGKYNLEVRSLTFNGLSKSTISKEFNVHIPGWFTWNRILYIVLGSIIVITSICMLGRKCYERNFGKKVQEYLRQTISANPEYLSLIGAYKVDEWELKRDDLFLDEEIGKGNFGKVFNGYGKNITSVCGVNFGDCAIKTVSESASHAEKAYFLLEANVMKQFDTSFIVKLLGVVSDGQPVLIVMELMQNGNLRDFLRSRRPDAEENTNNAPLPTMLNYFKWAIQIADGMAYLESLKFCHRDLAARNCMVSSDETVKIGDFGMAKDMCYHEYYRPAGRRLMPIRWMAPESLKDGIFTVKSDVWSYGIVLYEMLTLGEQPYAGLGKDEVFNYIALKRNILLKPYKCPDFWYDLMRICWKYDPSDRPWFYQIVMYMKNSVERIHFDNEMAAMFEEQCFVTTHFDQIDNEEYDFIYNEEAEKAKKEHILRGLEKLAARNFVKHEYQKKGYSDSESLKNSSDSIDCSKFNTLTINKMNDKFKSPETLAQKQTQEREKSKTKKDEDSHVSFTVPSRKGRVSRKISYSEVCNDVDQIKKTKQVTEFPKNGIRESV